MQQTIYKNCSTKQKHRQTKKYILSKFKNKVMQNNRNEFEEIRRILNELRNKRNKMVFIGGNYKEDKELFETLKDAIKEVGLIPIIAKDIFERLDPREIHDESLRLLHNCGFAIIDITNPAGQLMELERARDYNVVTFVSYNNSEKEKEVTHNRHPSRMPLTLSKVMESWGLGYLIQYETHEELKRFIKSILLINHLKETPEKAIEKIIGSKPEKIVLITSIGVLRNCGSGEKIKNLLSKFDERKIITGIITGWDFETRGKKMAETYGAKFVACEGGSILYTKSNDGWKEVVDICDDNSLNFVKFANKCVIYAINEYRKEKGLEKIVFFSQANKKSVCYYLNPPKKIRDKLDDMKNEEPITIEKFIEKVKSICEIDERKVSGSKVEYKKPKDDQLEQDLLYSIEKVNATERTFHPYSIIIEEDKIVVDLDPGIDYEEFSYKDIENIVERAFKEISKDYRKFEQLYTKIIPQRDICIDILCKSKDETLNPILKKIIAKDEKENTLIIYLSKGTESDIPMIFKGYSSEYKFIAVGDNYISDRLKRAGVIPLGDTAEAVIEKLLKILNKI